MANCVLFAYLSFKLEWQSTTAHTLFTILPPQSNFFYKTPISQFHFVTLFLATANLVFIIAT